MHNLLKTGATIAALGACNIALASEHFVVREYSVDVANLTEFRIDAGVGVLDVVSSEDNVLRVEVEIEGNRQGIFRPRKRDVSDIDIKARIKGDILYVELSDGDYDDIELHWRVELPSLERTQLDLAVGQMNVSVGKTNLEVDLGVGEVNVTMPRRYAGEIDMEVGVGGVNLRGADNVDNHRSITSGETTGRGDGSSSIEVDVGVGKATVVLSSAT